jgi:hypothetical protein
MCADQMRAASEQLQPVEGQRREALWRAALAVICFFPLLISAPTLNDRFADAEDALNATVWGLGARNLLALGPGASLRGALVSPFEGVSGNGVYAHHPPLPTWLMTIPVALGGAEFLPRLFSLLGAAATLALLAKVLRRFFSLEVSVASVAVVAASGYLLHDARMLTTLTLAAPLFVALLDAGLSWRERGAMPKWAALVAALLVLSAWDGFLGAAALCLAALTQLRRQSWKPLVAPALAALGAALFVAWHLIDATGGVHEMLWQASWRAAPELNAGDWLSKEAEVLAWRLGPVTLLLLAALPMLRRTAPAGALSAMLVAAVPGVGMMLIFRQGAQHHAFWGYQLVLPAAFAVALALSRLQGATRVALAAALLLQCAVQVGWAWERLSVEHDGTQVVSLLKHHFASARAVPIFSPTRFHPWVAWYTGTRPLSESTLDTLEAARAKDADPSTPVLVNTAHATKQGCAALGDVPTSSDGRWAVVSADALHAACVKAR